MEKRETGHEGGEEAEESYLVLRGERTLVISGGKEARGRLEGVRVGIDGERGERNPGLRDWGCNNSEVIIAFDHGKIVWKRDSYGEEGIWGKMERHGLCMTKLRHGTARERRYMGLAS